jgi:hypothetical protein
MRKTEVRAVRATAPLIRPAKSARLVPMLFAIIAREFQQFVHRAVAEFLFLMHE